MPAIRLQAQRMKYVRMLVFREAFFHEDKHLEGKGSLKFKE